MTNPELARQAVRHYIDKIAWDCLTPLGQDEAIAPILAVIETAAAERDKEIKAKAAHIRLYQIDEEKLLAERDTLSAEVERLKVDLVKYDAALIERHTLRAEVAALRKDKERIDKLAAMAVRDRMNVVVMTSPSEEGTVNNFRCAIDSTAAKETK